MSRVKAPSFGVRFYRRGVANTSAKKETADSVVQDNVYTQTQPPIESAETMSDIIHHVAKQPIDLHQEHTTPKAPFAKQTQTAAEPAGLKEKALWVAAKSGDLYAIRLLVLDGVDLDARDSQGRTAINIATQYGKQNALKTLLAAKEMRYMASLGELPDTKFFSKFQKAKAGNE